jgi:hypothetical protein
VSWRTSQPGLGLGRQNANMEEVVMVMPEQRRKAATNAPARGIDLVRTMRAMATAALIVGSTYVHHVASTQPSGIKQADLQHGSSLGIELALYIVENGKPLLNW